jgi:monoamine oxidase
MGRSPLFRDLNHAMRITLYCKKNHISTSQGFEQLAEIMARRTQPLTNKCEGMTQAAVREVGLVAQQLECSYLRSKMGLDVKIGIVGAGLAGLACGYELKQHGVFATVYEASNRVGGRCFSLGGAFPGAVTFPNQAIERGGEFIDSQNKTLLRLAKQFQLKLEDVSQQPREIACYFNRQPYSHLAVIDEYRNFLEAIDADLRLISSTPTAGNYTDADVLFDNINLLEYLETRQAGDLIKAAINASYMAEYGLELEEQSCLNFLLVVRDIENSEASPFHIFSDERYHIVGGNEQIVQGLSNELQGQINLGMRLVKVGKNSLNRIEVTFDDGTQTTTVEYDAVVLAIPFPVLRQVELDASLELPTWKLEAIAKLDNGTHAKMMLGFNGRPWVDFDSSGTSYSNLPNHQVTWETNPTQATNAHAVLVDYSSGKRGAKLDPNQVQTEANLFLSDLDQIYPGAIASATSDRTGNLLVHLEHWPSNPLVQGSYACYKPGQFTTIAGNEGKPIDNLFFAGEHTNSFYEWQGYMEGAVLSGIKAAQGILQHLKLKVLRC